MTTAMKNLLNHFRADQSGGAGIEYALIAGGIGLAVLGSVQIVSGEASTPFENVATGLSDGNP